MNLENKKQILIVLMAVGLGLVAALLTGNHIQDSIKKETARLSEEFEKTQVQPLVRELGDLRKEVERLKEAPPVVVQQGEGEEGEAPAVPKSSLALRTPAGKRAYTVMIDSLSAVGGLINPGDYIDIIAHMQMPDPLDESSQENITSMIFQNVQVLAVGTNFQAPGGYEAQQAAGALNITLAMSPEEAGLMSFIEKNGQMKLVLRPPAETETTILQAATWSTLADYVFEKQGTELVIPRSRAVIEAVSTPQKEEVKPFISIFQGGRQVN
ncbi:MAG: Flp pilus assembly protein CpaB [Candidatus Omnitrophica bacterium]|nr:Flp pilus assembly protein CpaB [Candidatus Omnitrophota bacterium]